MSKSDEARAHAKRARARAAELVDQPELARLYLKLAAAWQILAEDIEEADLGEDGDGEAG